MALFLQKPVFWNTNGYIKPSGSRAASGYPAEHGYGHEEWNNSPRMAFTRNGQPYRVFHTEGIGSAPLDQNAGQTFVFMTASHDGIQQLVGIAANAVSLIGDDYRHHRDSLASDLKIDELWSDAWQTPTVQLAYEGSQAEFRKEWARTHSWISNWVCPEEYFWWIEFPVTLNAHELVGKRRLLNMYGSFTTLDRSIAVKFMLAVPNQARGERWHRILDAIQVTPSDPILTPRDLIASEASVTETISEILARRGQGRFREQLMVLWQRSCAVTGLDCAVALRASHVKPWSKSTARERHDPQNGLILSANLDALFDAGLITFGDDGEMHVSQAVSIEHRKELGIPRPLRSRPSDSLRKYLAHHRRDEFQS